ncbi:GNAT family N-acetyltransferase [Azohydromonas caseinilytica]|uniref:GNAT family N-acetyltransferase n=1 Tax=Azohydromonas caseinilytica TaxID=2728836 RepID=A0A848F4P0_9BURK|nr:GNAT family N-acetyltransferase [Azohydromonas caseinilytica]NML15027.1 GNAT family N-acetyltransferase [Azohydromonas caseinilytica]
MNTKRFQPDIHIEAARPEDADTISRLIKSLSGAFTLDPAGQGAEGFMSSISPEAIRRYIEAPNFAYFKGVVDGELTGVVAVRDGSHLYHLFVDQKFQGRGLARALWAHARAHAEAAGNTGGFTVNATPVAVPVYEHFGFRATGPRMETMGIAYVPMRLERAAK